MKHYNLDYEKILEEFSSTKEGLSEKEALYRKTIYGDNKLEEAKKESNLSKFLREFKDIMIIILIIASIFSFVLSIINNESFLNSIIIIIIVIINAILGFVEEVKADKAIEALKHMQKAKTRVRRDGKVMIIDTIDLVPGDIIILEAGDQVPADARLIYQNSLKVNESSLTGESLPVEKNVDAIYGDVSISETYNMIYQGTDIIYGKCEAMVTETGMKTEFGDIAASLQDDTKGETPLQKKITNISKTLSIIIMIVIIIMLIIGLIKGMSLKDIVLLSISLAVAAIPEGLPAVITIVLSIGMNDLARKNAIVRKISSVETLGSTEVICSDKTGTITLNKMKVMEVFYNGKLGKIKDFPKDNILFDIMALNNDVSKCDDSYIGDPTEVALYESLEDVIDIEDVRYNKKRIDEIPFDSDRKMMSTINDVDGDIYLYTKGSFDSVIKNCTYIIENNKEVKLTKEKIKNLSKIEKDESSKAYRVLAYAYKKMKNKNDKKEVDLVFAGFTAMIDPPRDDVKESIAMCKHAHIRPIMITGDSLPTAVSIAKEIGIIKSEEEAITGLELDNMTEKQLMEAVTKYSVYARVSPTNKLDIVNALKKLDKVVAMTGDGVNDAPALKTASIGVGMGITGTEVSKGVSDIVLADDSFSTIVDAVSEGRRIFDNIRNVLIYLLAGNVAELIIVFVGMLFGIQVFVPIQILYLNLVTDSLPAISLAFEKADKDVMERDIRKGNNFFTPFLVSKMMISAILKAIVVFGVYYVNLKLYGIEIAQSASFMAIVMLEMIYAYSCKNLKKNIFQNCFLSNKVLNTVFILLTFVQIIVFLSPLRGLFNIVHLTAFQIAYVVLAVITSFLLDELLKPLFVKIFKD